MIESKTMTKEQEKFIVGKRLLSKFDEIKKTRELTPDEKMKEDKIKEQLYSTVVKYGMQLAKKRMESYAKENGAYQDIMQEMATIFFEKLPAYDPYRTTPTTFFKVYFNQVISEYLHRYSQHLKSHDAKNLTLINKAIQEYEAKGIEWDVNMLHNRTKLSIPQIKKTIQFSRNSVRAPIEDAEIMKSKQPTPEEYYLQNERHNTLIKELTKELNPKEVEFFLAKVNLDGEKDITYKELAKRFGLTHKDAKQKYNNIVTKLASNKNIQTYRYNTKRKKKQNVYSDTIQLNDAAGSIMELQITQEIEKLQFLQIEINLKEEADKKRQIHDDNKDTNK